MLTAWNMPQPRGARAKVPTRPNAIRMARAALLIAVAAGIPTRLHAQQSLLKDATFDAYRKGSPGPWELRYGHKGGTYPTIRPSWHGVSKVDDAKPGIGRFL